MALPSLRARRSAWLIAPLLLACSTDSEQVVEPSPDKPDSSTWISVYDPDRAWNGYTLAFYAHRIPILLDMNGGIVHRWPEARVKSRLRLLPDGSLLGIALGRGVVEYDWDGNKIWEFASGLGFAHHDVLRLASGNTVTIIRPDKGQFDVILEVDRSEQIVWQWDSAAHLRPFVSQKLWDKVDVTHLNSIQALPENRWFDEGDSRFRPGNFLISSREMNLVFIVDKTTQEVVWTFDADLDKQHEPLMADPESTRAGNILIFNNRYRSFYGDRQSAVLEIDPSRNRIVWQFRTAGFYSPTSGVEQPLPNGNILITSSRGARTFEIDRGGRIVWEWTPPFDTTRSRRYAYDHTPQLASLALPQETPVERPPGHRHIDSDVYRFARRGLRRTVRLDGQKREVLKHNNGCRRMMIPSEAVLDIEYGIDRQRIPGPDQDDQAVGFRLELRLLGTDETTVLLDDTVDLSGETWKAQTFDLGPFAMLGAELCTETTSSGLQASATEAFAFWQQPVIRRVADGASAVIEDDSSMGELTPEELEIRKKHLEALGYIN